MNQAKSFRDRLNLNHRRCQMLYLIPNSFASITSRLGTSLLPEFWVSFSNVRIYSAAIKGYVRIYSANNCPDRTWAQYSADLTRTTNSRESYPSKLNSTFYKAHPKIYNFIDTRI